jgi:hypothetical protein
MLLAYWQRLVAAGKAQKHKDGAYRRRYNDAA